MIEIKPLIIAHRGASFDRPENSFAAFKLAYDQGSDGIETDVHLSKDNVPVLIHDHTVNRVTSKKGLIKQFTFRELKQLDIGSWFDPIYHTERLMSLVDFLQWAEPRQLMINIELKTNKVSYPGIEAIVYQHVKRSKMLDRVVFSSFNHLSLEKLSQLDPNTYRALLAKRHSARLIKLSQQLNLTGVHINERAINQITIKKYHQINQYVGAYTVNQPIDLRRCLRANCDMIITDRPELTIEKKELFLSQKDDPF